MTVQRRSGSTPRLNMPRWQGKPFFNRLAALTGHGPRRRSPARRAWRYEACISGPANNAGIGPANAPFCNPLAHRYGYCDPKRTAGVDVKLPFALTPTHGLRAGGASSVRETQNYSTTYGLLMDPPANPAWRWA